LVPALTVCALVGPVSGTSSAAELPRALAARIADLYAPLGSTTLQVLLLKPLR
jgi:hypothetical protein